MEEFNYTFGKFSKALEYIGQNLFGEDYSPTLRTYLVELLMFSAHVCTFNSLYITYPDFHLGVQLLSAYGFIIQVKIFMNNIYLFVYNLSNLFNIDPI